MTNKPEDAATDLLIQEVDEELRQEQLHKAWKKYGNLVIGGAVALVLGVAGWQGYNGWQVKQRQLSSAEYTAALQLLEQGKLDDAAKALAKISVDGTAGYRLLAEIKQADMKQAAGDTVGAIATYDHVAATSGNDPLFRDLARLKAAYMKIDSAAPDSIERDISPMTAESNPWRHSAREIMALLAIKRGDQAKAIDWFSKVADDGGAPSAIRTRATEMLAALSAKPSQR